MIERLFWYTDVPAGITDLEYESYGRLTPMSDKTMLSNAATGVTLTALVTTNGGFAMTAAGDLINIKQSGADYSVVRTKLVTKNSDSEIEVADAVDLSTVKAAWSWQKRSKGTTATDGWIGCNFWTDKSIKFAINTIPTGGFNVSIEGRYDQDQTPAIIYQRQYTAVTDYPQIIQVTEDVSSLRVGLSRVSAGSDGSITVALYGNPSR